MSGMRIVFLHPPSLLERRRTIPGLFAESVDGSGHFTRFPLGFISLSNYLSERGWECRILNLAARLARSGYDRAVADLKQLDAEVVGIGIHWLVHAPGALAAAQIIKQKRPETKTIVGGFTASYFHEELIAYPQVDFVLRGESTEKPLFELVAAIKSSGDFGEVPNLVWKDRGEIVINPFTYSPDVIDVDYSYHRVIENFLRYRDFWGSLPSPSGWFKCLQNVVVCRGCNCRCANCGGSNIALGRKTIVRRNTEDIVREVLFAERVTPSSEYIMLYGDVRMVGTEEIIDGLTEARIKNPLRYELFWPADGDFLQDLAGTTRKLLISFSPESHDELVRQTFGKNYSNRKLERMIADALQLGADLTLFFMVGLPYQTPASVRDTYRYIEYLLEEFGAGYPGRLLPCIYTLAPYLDPGSPAFLEPDDYGYRLFYRTLAEHLDALNRTDASEILNYETVAMSREEIVRIGYEMTEKMDKLHEKHGLRQPKPTRRKLTKVQA
ncbi:MAG: B12-binding domain-containing radical SAM protein [Actinobacteria bacterium]|nr:B12-binding domain-containing radical SAM protein [Actinomycetota bacterium]